MMNNNLDDRDDHNPSYRWAVIRLMLSVIHINDVQLKIVCMMYSSLHPLMCKFLKISILPPQKGIFVRPHPSENSNQASYISLNLLVIENPHPSHPGNSNALTFPEVVWRFSETSQWAQLPNSLNFFGIFIVGHQCFLVVIRLFVM